MSPPKAAIPTMKAVGFPIFRVTAPSPLRPLPEAVDLPSQEERENEEYYDVNNRGSRDKSSENSPYDPGHPEDHAHPPEASAKVRSPEHGHAEGDKAYRQKQAIRKEGRTEYALEGIPP